MLFSPVQRFTLYKYLTFSFHCFIAFFFVEISG